MKNFFNSLTKQQEELVEKLENFLTNDSNIFLLKGYAGVGKTYITQGLTQYLHKNKRNFTLSAPTGKATKVIQEKTNFEANTIHKTIYSSKLLKEYKKDDEKTYKFYFDLNTNELPANNVYIIDEASMISNKYSEMEFIRFGSGYLLDDLMKFINIDSNDHNKKIIFIGDNAQLPPINMNFSPALNKEYLEKKYNLKVEEFELTQVVRQKENSEILKNSITLRESIKSKKFIKLDISAKKEIKEINVENIKSIYFTSKTAPKHTMIIAYTNKSVYNYNQQIRSHYFKDVNKLYEHDKLIVTMNSLSTGLSNGDFIMVKEILNDIEERNVSVTKKTKVSLKFRDIVILYKDNQNQILQQQIKIIENLLFSPQPNLSSDEHKALYIDFCIRNNTLKPNTQEFTEALKKDPYFNALRVKFGYAITCHKAQGSEWENVILDCDFTQKKLSENYFRWLYTAITRSKTNLYLINNQKLSQFQQIKINKNNSTAIKNSQDNKFNIQNEFLLTIYQKVTTLLNKEIKEVKHSNYLETYICEDETIKIYYNSKNIITKIDAPMSYEILKPLIKVILVTQTNKFEFEFEFLKNFYNEIKTKLKNIKIVNIQNFPYLQRYTFQRDEEIAVINFYYKKNQLSIPQIHKTTNSHQLAKEILETLFKG